MPRCPDCNKFVSVEMSDPELDDLEVDPEGNITGTVRLIQTCADCGAELAEANIEVSESVEFTHAEGCKEESGLEIENAEATSEDRFEGKGRGARHFYQAVIQGEVVCPDCEARADFEFTVEEQASAFESLV